MSTILKNFTFIGEIEIIKFVQDIFDALFSILDSEKNKDQSLDSLVFSALIFILGIITDKRFTVFRPVLDVYIEMVTLVVMVVWCDVCFSSFSLFLVFLFFFFFCSTSAVPWPTST